MNSSGEKAERRARGYPLDAEETVEALRSGIDTTWENIRCLMDALDDIALIHPFVAGRPHLHCPTPVTDGFVAPILAFKAVYCMERTRRENNKRVVSLHYAMKEMISVLVEYVFIL